MSKVKILIAYHKKDFLLKDEILMPIHAGRAIAEQKGSPDLEWLQEHMEGDNTGDNISMKNMFFNEMTVAYWAWKNYEKIGNPDYIGFMHYRRHFYLANDTAKSVVEWDDMTDTYLQDIGYSTQVIDDVLSDCDFVCTMPQYRVSLYEHYKRNHRIEDLDRAIEIMDLEFPHMALSARNYLNGTKAYFCNMFIMPKEMFFEYCHFIFSVLFKYEKKHGVNKRTFLSEWLTGIYINWLLEGGAKCKFLPTVVAEGIHKIPIVLSTDENYAPQLSVTLVSILKNAKVNTFYEFFVLVPTEFSEFHKSKVLSLQDVYPNCLITFINVEGHFEDVRVKTAHLSKVAFFRLLSAEVLSNQNKVLYLDVDIVVEDDLSILYRISLDDFYIAGVKAAGYYYPDHWREKVSQELGVPVDQYINSGVLLMDLEKFRQVGLTEKFVELSQNNYTHEDQDVINVACYNQIKHLHMKFNVMTKYLRVNSEEWRIMHKVFPGDIIDEALKRPVIIHYAARLKPWNDLTQPYAKQWWENALISPYAGEFAGQLLALKGPAITKEKIKEIDTAPFDKKIAMLQTEIDTIKSSSSFRTGRFVTFIPRMCKRFCQCWKDHGFGYTCKYAVKRVLKKLRGDKS